MVAKTVHLSVLGLMLAGLSMQKPAAVNCPAFTPVCNVVPISEVPKHLHCGASGVVATPNVLQTTCFATFDDCRDACLSKKKACISFSYDSSLTTCTLYTKRVIKQTYTHVPSSTELFYNHKCFTFDTNCGTGPTGPDVCTTLSSFAATDNSGDWTEVTHGSGISSIPKANIITPPITTPILGAATDCDAINQCAAATQTYSAVPFAPDYDFFEVSRVTPFAGTYLCISYGSQDDVITGQPDPLVGESYDYNLVLT